MSNHSHGIQLRAPRLDPNAQTMLFEKALICGEVIGSEGNIDYGNWETQRCRNELLLCPGSVTSAKNYERGSETR